MEQQRSEQTRLEQKNRKNMDKLNSIILDYQDKLDKRVSQVVSQIINYTRKIADPQLLPTLRDKKTPSQHHPRPHRNKSSSQHPQLSFITGASLNIDISDLKSTFKEIESSKVILEPGRSVGNRSVAKPKFVRRKPDILPREIRLNPLYERNAIKAHELEKGVMTLLEKGKIGKDVNIITAFEKGRPVLQAQKAIFHQGEERFAQIERERVEQSPQGQKEKKRKTEKNDLRERMFQESWALTMPKEDLSTSKVLSSSLQHRQVHPLELNFKERIYIKIQHFKVQEDGSYREALARNLQYKGDILQILYWLTKVMRSYSIEIGYVDVSKVLTYITRTNKLTQSQLFDCISGFNKTNNLRSLKEVRGLHQKYRLALDYVVSSMKFNVQRKVFLKYLTKKKIANRIYGWAVSCWTVKKNRELIRQRRERIYKEYEVMQEGFRESFVELSEKKHIEIHLINEEVEGGKKQYRDILNIQITKIFNIRNINKHIIYLLPHALDDETINYYYKIMELEEIPNYRQRVSFLQVDPHGSLHPSLCLSARTYYHSGTLRLLKKRVKDTPAYFVLSYPKPVNIDLSVYLGIPILSASLRKTEILERRTKLAQFNVQNMDCLGVEGFKHPNLFSLADQISEYCEGNKRTNKYVVKLNGVNKGRGIALLTAPFSSLPEMYSNTALINAASNIDDFFHRLLQEGGIVQKYIQRVSYLSAVLDITLDGQVKVVGTFEKISSGFVNIAYLFPQKKVQHKAIQEISAKVGAKLATEKFFGTAELTMAVNHLQDLYLEKVQCYSTHLTSALHYYRFLSDGYLHENGEYMAKIIDTFENQGKEEEVVTFEPRSFCYVPFLLHFGLSDRQANSFFQLCRMGGVSFDLESKYGATFILLGSIKSSLGLITTAKDKKGAVKLMGKSLQFILKQNSSNMSNETLAQKQVRMKERENIINVKERLESI